MVTHGAQHPAAHSSSTHQRIAIAATGLPPTSTSSSSSNRRLIITIALVQLAVLLPAVAASPQLHTSVRAAPLVAAHSLLKHHLRQQAALNNSVLLHPRAVFRTNPTVAVPQAIHGLPLLLAKVATVAAILGEDFHCHSRIATILMHLRHLCLNRTRMHRRHPYLPSRFHHHHTHLRTHLTHPLRMVFQSSTNLRCKSRCSASSSGSSSTLRTVRIVQIHGRRQTSSGSTEKF